MSDRPVVHPRLRSDLACVVTPGRTRAQRMVIDEISGRFSRISERAWTLLNSGVAEPTLWQQAAGAGWLRTRTESTQPRFSPLVFRIPLGSIDRVAAWLAPRTDILFSSTAILCWSLLMAAAMLISISSREQWMDAVVRMPVFVAQLHPLALAAVFVMTKLIHELSHAIACRRVGARCGEIGVLVMCGMPCPYCDVTDVWRVPRAASRCGVMLAGIYVELIVASLAMLGWYASRDPGWQLFFVYVILVCGVSTLVFNANPLMRYDGYHALGDLVGSVNLRGEAREAASRFIDRVVGGRGSNRTFRQSRRVYWLAIYHAASSVYRVFIAVAIASLVVYLFAAIHLRPIAVVFVAVAFFVAVLRSVKKLGGVMSGAGRWSSLPSWRRHLSVLAMVASVVAVLFTPLPRYRHLLGRIEAADAVTVYVHQAGTIHHVDAEIGSLVTAGQRLLSIDNPDAVLDSLRMRSQYRLASLSRQNSDRSALDRRNDAKHWEILKASEAAMQSRWQAAERREFQNQVLAPVTGIVLPPDANEPLAVARTDSDDSSQSLLRMQGLGALASGAWCRISPTRSRRIALSIDARDYQHLAVGNRVAIHQAGGTATVDWSQIDSFSPAVAETSSVTNAAFFQATCPLARVDDEPFFGSIGTQCEVVVHLGNRSLAGDLADGFKVWLRG